MKKDVAYSLTELPEKAEISEISPSLNGFASLSHTCSNRTIFDANTSIFKQIHASKSIKHHSITLEIESYNIPS